MTDVNDTCFCLFFVFFVGRAFDVARGFGVWLKEHRRDQMQTPPDASAEVDFVRFV